DPLHRDARAGPPVPRRLRRSRAYVGADPVRESPTIRMHHPRGSPTGWAPAHARDTEYYRYTCRSAPCARKPDVSHASSARVAHSVGSYTCTRPGIFTIHV